MTILLKNVTSKKVLTLRYGDGMNSLLQLLPGEEKPVPVLMRKGLLQYYLSVFRGDLEVIDSEQKESKKMEEPNDVTKENEAKISKEEDKEKDETESSSDDVSNTGNPENGENDPLNPEDNSENGEDGENDPLTEDKENDPLNPDNSETEKSNIDIVGDNKETKELTEKELTKLSAEKIKELAKSLGIEVTDSSTKKALIPVILNKQGN